jgi:hypothetical protein
MQRPKRPPLRRPLFVDVMLAEVGFVDVMLLKPCFKSQASKSSASRSCKDQRVLKRPFIPPGSGAGSVARCSTQASTSERCDGESLIKAFHSRKPCTVSLDGYPSLALTSETDVRFFISRLLSCQVNLAARLSRPDEVESMPRNNSPGKAVSYHRPYIEFRQG